MFADKKNFLNLNLLYFLFIWIDSKIKLDYLKKILSQNNNFLIKFVSLLSFNRKSKLLLTLNFFISILITNPSKAEIYNFDNPENNPIEVDYLNSRNELEDYIIDTGDSIAIDFFPADELSGIYPVSAEGEMFLPKIDETYVRGLTISDLRKLLEQRYSKYLIDPEIKIRIAVFKSMKVTIQGEVRNPGIYKFPAYQSRIFGTPEIDVLGQRGDPNYNVIENLESNLLSDNLVRQRFGEELTTISEVIRRAGGITSKTDLARIEVIRKVPIAKGGGKKRAVVDLNSLLTNSDPTNDIRLFNGDILLIPELPKASDTQIPKSILSGLSPKFITIALYGRIENPGFIKLPLGASLSDAIDLTGPIKPLSGKIVLIRYDKDGTVIKKNISYASRAKRGSKRNPFIKEGDQISVKDSVLSATTGFLGEVTQPFIGIYATRGLYKDFRDNW